MQIEKDLLGHRLTKLKQLESKIKTSKNTF